MPVWTDFDTNAFKIDGGLAKKVSGGEGFDETIFDMEISRVQRRFDMESFWYVAKYNSYFVDVEPVLRGSIAGK